MRHSSKKTWLIVVIAVVLLALILEIIVYLKVSGVFDRFTANVADESAQSGEKWDEGVIIYKGKKYLYNKNLKNYLFLGIDKEGEVEVVDDGIKGGQSDAMYLLVQNTKTNSMSIVTIHRNAMTIMGIMWVSRNSRYVFNMGMEMEKEPAAFELPRLCQSFFIIFLLQAICHSAWMVFQS